MRSRGFTLIEMLVSVAIVATVMTLVWGTFRSTFKTRRQVESFSGRYRTVRLALERLARDLSMAYVSQNEDTAQPERRTKLVGKRHVGGDELTFSYFGHQRLYQDANESDTALVSYYTQTDREDSRKTNLIRRETRRLAYDKINNIPSEGDIICDDIVAFKLDYWDARDKKWRDEWVTTAADGQPDRLPTRVRITLTVRDERGREVPFMSEARIPMQEPLNLTATDAVSAPPTGGTGTGTPGTGTSGTGTSGSGSGSGTNQNTPQQNFRNAFGGLR
jgi:general secretion pathway protein J